MKTDRIYASGGFVPSNIKFPTGEIDTTYYITKEYADSLFSCGFINYKSYLGIVTKKDAHQEKLTKLRYGIKPTEL